jgi:ABC-type Zn2+ transport system substrate-binding protein/surface adhesin
LTKRRCNDDNTTKFKRFHDSVKNFHENQKKENNDNKNQQQNEKNNHSNHDHSRFDAKIKNDSKEKNILSIKRLFSDDLKLLARFEKTKERIKQNK